MVFLFFFLVLKNANMLLKTITKHTFHHHAKTFFKVQITIPKGSYLNLNEFQPPKIFCNNFFHVLMVI